MMDIKAVHPQLSPEDVAALEEKVVVMVDAISDSFSEAEVPLSVGVAVCLTLILQGVSHADKCPTTRHMRGSVIAALRTMINFLERDPVLVEGPDRPM